MLWSWMDNDANVMLLAISVEEDTEAMTTPTDLSLAKEDLLLTYIWIMPLNHVKPRYPVATELGSCYLGPPPSVAAPLFPYAPNSIGLL